MGKKDSIIYLEHIQDCIDKVFRYTEGIDLNKFLEDTMVQDGVIRNFEIIDEVAK